MKIVQMIKSKNVIEIPLIIVEKYVIIHDRLIWVVML